MRKVIIALFVFTACISYAQNLDSLWKVYENTAQPDTCRLKSIEAIAQSYKSNKPDTAIIIARKELALAKESKQKKYEGNAYNKIGLSYMNKGNYPEALKNYYSALKIHESINDKYGISASLNNIGNIYYLQGNYQESLKMFQKDLEICEELKNKKGIASSRDNIGVVYQAQGNYKEALKEHNRSLDLFLELKDKQGLSIVYNNIGNVNSYLNNNSEAMKSYLSSLKIKEEINDKYGIASSLLNLGIINTNLKKPTEARMYLNKALLQCQEIGNIEEIMYCYGSLTFLDSIVGNFKDAFNHYKLYVIYSDRLNNEETKKKSIETSLQYEFDKKEAISKVLHKKDLEKQSLLAEEKSRKQRIVIWSVIGGFFISLVFAIYILRALRITNRQKQIIEKQKQKVDTAYNELDNKNKEIELQKHLVEEHQKEIIDSINYAERIQRSFIATKETLDENLNNYFVFFKPKDIVSGDFYWASKLNNGNFALVTADSTGHGVPGAIMSLLNVTSLEKAIEVETEPSKILNITRKIIIERLKKDGSLEGGKDGMDCSITVYDFLNKKIFIAAANNPVWIVRGEELIEIKPDKMPVGKSDKDQIGFTQQEIEFQSGDVIYTLTDGYADQFGGEKGKKFMSKNLRELLTLNSNLPMHEQKKQLEMIFANWIGNMEQVDDVTIIGVRI